jgi:Cu/Ag efflux protein CusF
MAIRKTHRPAAVLPRYASVRLVALATLAGLFAMHGLSADHMLSPSRAQASMTMSADSSSPTTRDGTTTTSVQHQDVNAQDHPAMTMNGCLASLRGQNTLIQPSPLGIAALPAARQGSANLPTQTAAARAPPQPPLTRLCISRT